jgi:hypothetical protein
MPGATLDLVRRIERPKLCARECYRPVKSQYSHLAAEDFRQLGDVHRDPAHREQIVNKNMGGETMRSLSIVLVCLSLVGCAAAAKDDTKCRSYGSSPGEPAYVQCRATLDAARTQAEAIGAH